MLFRCKMHILQSPFKFTSKPSQTKVQKAKYWSGIKPGHSTFQVTSIEQNVRMFDSNQTHCESIVKNVREMSETVEKTYGIKPNIISLKIARKPKIARARLELFV